MKLKSIKNLKNELIYNLINPKDHLNVLSFLTDNYGDYYNRIIFNQIANKNIHITDINLYRRLEFIKSFYSKKPLFVGIGSILHFATQQTVVWGTGSLWYNSTPPEKPKKILAVRGYYTGRNLEGKGYEFDRIYGDPGLLASKFYQPENNSFQKKYRLGIIPHLFEKKLKIINDFKDIDDIKIIDIENTDNLFEEMNSCENIASSSLHGLVFADSFQIPNTWIKLSDKIHGGEFKYLDYYSSLLSKKEINYEPLIVTDIKDHKNILKTSTIKEIKTDLTLLEGSLKNYIENNLK